MIWRAFILCTVLAACSSSPEARSPLVDAFKKLTSREQPTYVPRFASLLQKDALRLQVGFVDLGVSTRFLLERRSGGFEYWLSSEGTHIVLQSGMLHSTRGLGEGLMASELSEPLALVLNRRSGSSDRFHTYLDGNDRSVTRTYRCLIESEGPKQIQLPNGPADTILMTENCRSLDHEFLNFYWVSTSSGRIIQSRQWAGPEIGPVSTRIISR